MTDDPLAGILHQPGQGQFLNPRLAALNVFEVDIPDDVIAQCGAFIPDLRSVVAQGETVALPLGPTLSNQRPQDWHSDICWLSHEDEQSYAWFEQLFDRIGLAEIAARLIPHDHEIRLYSGFFVTRSRCEALDMHCDWLTANNQAFTLMAPLTANCTEIGLSYRDLRGGDRDYAYRLGKGIVFGTRFAHSTAIGQSAERSVFLSFTFGTDRMEHWPEIARTAATQGKLHRRPDGSFARRAANAKGGYGKATA